MKDSIGELPESRVERHGREGPDHESSSTFFGEGLIAVEPDGFNRYGRAAWSCPSEVAPGISG